MCGRIGLNLNCDSIRSACAYKPRKKNTYEKPEWLNEHNDGRTYTPSNNIAPTDVTPVLVSSQKFQSNATELILKPMMWGMIPPWHKGDYRKHGLSTNNCRIENIFTSKLYGAALREGQRCVVIAVGFYEWQTTDKTAKTKQPYFIYTPQDNNVQVDDQSTWLNEFDESQGWKGVKLLKMAALYNNWRGQSGPIYSYSIVTLESNSTMDWLHHRMPAILDSDDMVEKWLDIENVNSDEAVSLLKPVQLLSWHPVSTLVNNSRNKIKECNKCISLDKKEKTSSISQKLMSAWLTSRRETKTTALTPKKIMNEWLGGKSTKRKSGETDLNTKRVKME